MEKEKINPNESVCPTCGKTVTFLKNVVLPFIAFIKFVINLFKK